LEDLVVLTPLFIAGVSPARRKWGSAVAGTLAGLPLTSGPVSVFLALGQGICRPLATRVKSMLI